jgi:hypothetical protein
MDSPFTDFLPAGMKIVDDYEDVMQDELDRLSPFDNSSVQEAGLFEGQVPSVWQKADQQNQQYRFELGWSKYYDDINQLLLDATGQSGKTLGGEHFAFGVAQWQKKNGFYAWNVTGVIDAVTWNAMRAVITPRSVGSASCDLSIAVPDFSISQRQTIDPLLLTQAENKKAIDESVKYLGSISVDPAHVRTDLQRYVDLDLVKRAIDNYNKLNPSAPIAPGTAPLDAVFAEGMHQFQLKVYFDKEMIDGKLKASAKRNGIAHASALHSLGIIHFKQSGLFTNSTATAQLKKHGIKTVINGKTCDHTNWFSFTYNPSVLGSTFKISVHYLLIKQLRIAEKYLLGMPRFKGDSLVGMGVKLGLYAYPERHVGGRSSGTAMHIYGLAMDLQYFLNPWIGAGWIKLGKGLLERTKFLEDLRKAAPGETLPGSKIGDYLHHIGLTAGGNTYAAYTILKKRHDQFVAYIHQPANAKVLAYWRGSFTYDNHKASNGFLNMDPDLVFALRQKGNLAWGAIDFGGASGDIMHFDLRTMGAGREINKKKDGIRGADPTETHPFLRTDTGTAVVGETMDSYKDHSYEDYSYEDADHEEELLHDEDEYSNEMVSYEEEAEEHDHEAYESETEPAESQEEEEEKHNHDHEQIAEEHEQPLLQQEYADPADGATFYLPISVGGGIMAKTGVYIPASYKPGEYVDIVLYLHGHVGKKIRQTGKWVPDQEFMKRGMEYYWKNYSNIREHFKAGQHNAILVAPTLGSLSSTQYGTLANAKGLDNFINACFAALKLKKALHPMAMPYRIVLAGHSGGGNPMGKILVQQNDLADKICEVWGFDCLYGDKGGPWSSNYVKWVKAMAGKRPPRRFYHYWAESKSDTPAVRGAELEKLQPLYIMNIAPPTYTTHRNIIQQAWLNDINKRPFLSISAQKPKRVFGPEPESYDEAPMHDEWDEHEMYAMEMDSDAETETDADTEMEYADDELSEEAVMEDWVPGVPVADIRKRLDDFFDKSLYTYKLADGTEIKARSQFRLAIHNPIPGEITSEEAKKKVNHAIRSRRPALKPGRHGPVHRAAYGKASPEEIGLVTQALIDAGELDKLLAANPSLVTDAKAIRQMQKEFGVGTDCGGYTQLAYMYAYTGKVDDSMRTNLGLKAERGDENLRWLPPTHFRKVDIKDVRTGDLMIMDPRRGDTSIHTVIVISHTTVNSLHTFEVDSSWGRLYGDDAAGIARRILCHEVSTGQWWDIHPINKTPEYVNTIGPYREHPLQGFYRPRVKPVSKEVEEEDYEESIEPEDAFTSEFDEMVTDVAKAVEDNRKYSASLGWHVFHEYINNLLLPFSGQQDVSLNEEDFAQAVSQWQLSQGLSSDDADGVIGPNTWKLMKPQIAGDFNKWHAQEILNCMNAGIIGQNFNAKSQLQKIVNGQRVFRIDPTKVIIESLPIMHHVAEKARAENYTDIIFGSFIRDASGGSCTGHCAGRCIDINYKGGSFAGSGSVQMVIKILLGLPAHYRKQLGFGMPLQGNFFGSKKLAKFSSVSPSNLINADLQRLVPQLGIVFPDNDNHLHVQVRWM